MNDVIGNSWKKLLFEKKYPLWILLLITTVYAIIFMMVIYPIN